MALSAFIVQVSEAEPFVGQLRERFDPSARLGVPAHITILYPFMSPEQVSDDVLDQARKVIASFPSFAFELAKVRQFPGSVYLYPEPADPFIAMAHALARAFPEWPPYGGGHDAVVPHLTVARTGAVRMQRIDTMLGSALAARGIRARCAELHLIENSARVWRPFHAFALGPAADGGASQPGGAGGNGTATGFGGPNGPSTIGGAEEVDAAVRRLAD